MAGQTFDAKTLKFKRGTKHWIATALVVNEIDLQEYAEWRLRCWRANTALSAACNINLLIGTEHIGWLCCIMAARPEHEKQHRQFVMQLQMHECCNGTFASISSTG